MLKSLNVTSTTGHRKRLRERLLKAPHALPDYEILECLLFAGDLRRDMKPLAKKLEEAFGSLAGVLTAMPERLGSIPGVTVAHIAYIAAVREAALRILKQSVLHAPVIDQWDALVDYCHARMAALTTEEFRVLYLDTKNRMMADECLGNGTVSEVVVYPRSIIKRALELDSSALIILHNHPSGDATPSVADHELTGRIVQACEAVGIIVHDHVIISKTGYYSFRGQGTLPSAK